MGNDRLNEKLNAVEGDVYLMTQTLKQLTEAVSNLQADNEKLLNRIKCLECNQCSDPTTDLMA